MSRTVAVMQPTYLPYLGYFDLIAQADVFVFLDDVQFERKSWQQRNRVAGPDGEVMLSVPVRKQPLQTLIRDIEIDDHKPWRAEHRDAIASAYGACPYYNDGAAFIEAALRGDDRHKLADLTCGMIEKAAGYLGIGTEFVRASTLGCRGRRSEHVLAICLALGADEYVSPRGSAEYMREDGVFEAAGFPVRFRAYAPTAYPQAGHAAFTPYLGFVDAVMNLGWGGLADHLRAVADQLDWRPS